MYKWKGKRIMMWIIGTVLIVIIVIAIFFNIPYSKTISQFNTAVADNINNINDSNELITISDIENLPIPVQKYFKYCGYIGSPKESYMKLTIKDATLISDGKVLNTEYIQYNFVEEPVRLALIKSSIAGIPFQGFDSYENGVGSMRGVIGKLITLFDVRGIEMNQACLATFLSEILLSPTAALQNYITWTEIDELHVQAVITYYGISVRGLFTFDEKGLLLSFETNDRYFTNPDGTMTQLKWTALFDNYVSSNGLIQPTCYKAIWNYPDNDLVYFDADNTNIQYSYENIK